MITFASSTRARAHCLCSFRRTDSEVFEDAVELQQFYVKIRDELCKNGEILLSPAVNYTSKHLHGDVEQEKRDKIPEELEEDKQKREEESKGMAFTWPTRCLARTKSK